jgi:hypothetical protein
LACARIYWQHFLLSDLGKLQLTFPVGFWVGQFCPTQKLTLSSIHAGIRISPKPDYLPKVARPESVLLQQNIRSDVDHLHFFTSYEDVTDVLGFI